jgi:hypothetical protein
MMDRLRAGQPTQDVAASYVPRGEVVKIVERDRRGFICKITERHPSAPAPGESWML